jgi:hypothetical protein
MKKKYLTTIEDLLALKNTDTKIYCKDITAWYCQFIGGVLCVICTDKTATFNASITVNGNYYILEEEPVKEADENDIGKLCWVWDDECKKRMGILDHIEDGLYYVRNWFYSHCRRLTPSEVAEITGYKVEEEV